MFRFTKRSITTKEAHILVEQIKRTPNITGYSFSEWLNFESVLVAEDNNQNMLGVCLYYDFGLDFTFISVLFVLEEFRGKGIGTELFYRAVDDILNRQKNIYTASRNLSIIKMMNELKFITFDSLFNLPESYQRYEQDFIIHTLRWSASFYRVKEMIRKLSKYRSSGKFTYGIKDYIK